MMYYINFMMIFLINSLLMMIMILISIAFLTLLERKILGYIQIRKGPNKVGMMGIFQPFSDAIKLFNKEMSMIFKSNYLFYLIMPLFSMLLMLMLWNLIPYSSMLMNNNLSIMLLMCIMSMGVYSLMISGWSSNSMYSLLGGLRGIAQTISYEVSMIFIFLSLILLMSEMNLYKFFLFQKNLWMLFMNFFLMIMFLVIMLAEMNRTPFDFSEGESELVSGFNTEYMSGSFALIFIAEYGMIMFSMMLMNIMFFGMNFWSIYSYLMYLMLLFLILWVRGTFPRFRYDNLMYLTWYSLLPVSMNFIIYFMMIKLLNFMI